MRPWHTKEVGTRLLSPRRGVYRQFSHFDGVSLTFISFTVFFTCLFTINFVMSTRLRIYHIKANRCSEELNRNTRRPHICRNWNSGYRREILKRLMDEAHERRFLRRISPTQVVSHCTREWQLTIPFSRRARQSRWLSAKNSTMVI